MANHVSLEKELCDLCLVMLDLIQLAKDSGRIDEETYLIHVTQKREFLGTHNPTTISLDNDNRVWPNCF